LSNSLLRLDLKTIRLPAWLSLGGGRAGGAGLRIAYPPVAVDMGTRHVAMARLARDKERKTWSLASFDTVEIPPDLLDTDVFQYRVTDRGRLQALVSDSLGKDGVRPEKISLVLPDHFARVALLPFEELPRTRRELVTMIQWKMKKAVPFRVDEASIDYEVLPGAGGGHTVLAALMPMAIVEEHETIFSRQGIRPGLIDLSTFSVAHLYRSVIDREVPAAGDFMLVNATGAFLTAMIFRAGTPIFYRCKTFGFGGERDPRSDHRLFHREIQASILYYQERLAGHSLDRVYMRLVGHDPERVADLFADAPVAGRPEPIDVRRVVSVDGRVEGLGAARSHEMLQRLAPAIGAALGRESQGRTP
jgi:hypothetical protein